MDLLKFIIESERIDTIMHFAAQTHVDNSFGNSLAFTVRASFSFVCFLFVFGARCAKKKHYLLNTPPPPPFPPTFDLSSTTKRHQHR